MDFDFVVFIFGMLLTQIGVIIMMTSDLDKDQTVVLASCFAFLFAGIMIMLVSSNTPI